MSFVKVCASLTLLALVASAKAAGKASCEQSLASFTIDEFKFGTYSTKDFPRGSINVDPVTLTTFVQTNVVYDPIMTQLDATVYEWSNSVDCNSALSSGPDMIFVINGKELHITAKDYVVTYQGSDFCTTSIDNSTSNPGFDFTLAQNYRQQICALLQ